MDYYIDFKNMRNNEFFDNNSIKELYDSDIANHIKSLSEDLRNLINKDENYYIENTIKIMTELACYKAAINMRVRINVLKDSKNPNKRYLQARGAVAYEKGERAWAGEYLGTMDHHDYDTSKTNSLIKKGRVEVIKKVIIKLRKEKGV